MLSCRVGVIHQHFQRNAQSVFNCNISGIHSVRNHVTLCIGAGFCIEFVVYTKLVSGENGYGLVTEIQLRHVITVIGVACFHLGLRALRFTLGLTRIRTSNQQGYKHQKCQQQAKRLFHVKYLRNIQL